MLYNFTVSTESSDRLDLKERFKQYAAELWIPNHLLPNDAARFALDCFKRTALSDLEMLGVLSRLRNQDR